GRPPTATVGTAWRVARPRTLARPGRGGDADDPSVAPLGPLDDSRGYAAVRPSQRPRDEPDPTSIDRPWVSQLPTQHTPHSQPEARAAEPAIGDTAGPCEAVRVRGK